MDLSWASLLKQVSLQAIITCIAAIAAMFSAYSAWRSSRAARESLSMAKIEFEERHDSIRAHLIDCLSWDSSKSESIASFACSYSNAANAPNTIIRLELSVHALNSDGTQTTIVLEPTLDNQMSLRGIAQLSVPLNLSARSTSSGWISFVIPQYISDTKRIDKYQVVAITSTGRSITLESYILRKRQYEVREN